ncbi:uncharacterized protein LOC102708377 [Oryza brachyantha]|uniref:uncharacterized protein LOC102708377 n=1 Tax=Oryza brachyantha TaxID=4533 RepID=UPI001ADC8C87|nr:uncharacterized protein LOC102708377 [Oryza brachyantha]
MGCAGSKDVTVADVYRPPPTSVSLFDVSAIEEPWLIATGKKDGGDGEASDVDDDDDGDEEEEEEEEGKKPSTAVPLPLLEKLDGFDLAPASWSEVSKALEDIKPTLNSKTTENTKLPAKKKTKKKKKKQPAQAAPPPPTQTQPETAKTSSVPGTDEAAKKAALPPEPSSVRGANHEVDKRPPPPELTGRRVVKDNPFLMRDRENKGNDGAAAAAAKWRRRDPFEGYPERRPPGASGGGVVLYTTTLRGVRRTFEDCERARQAVETCAEAVSAAGGSPVVADERDVSLHGEYLRELRELAGEGAAPPRLFVMGRYLGGADACAELAESGKLREMMRWARARGEACAAKDGRGCEGCGGARFVPCWECGGSCKVVAGDGGGDVERCSKCNENGLMLCPICH